LFRAKVYVPKDIELEREITWLHHDLLTARHLGWWRTMELVLRNYWWPGMSKFVLSYMDGCDICARGISYPEKPVGKLMLNLIPIVLWLDISVDCITGLPKAQGYNAIVVVCDHYTKQVHIIPSYQWNQFSRPCTTVSQLHMEIAWLTISDHGPQIAATFMKELNKW
jgi:Integrase zinc binding domain